MEAYAVALLRMGDDDRSALFRRVGRPDRHEAGNQNELNSWPMLRRRPSKASANRSKSGIRPRFQFARLSLGNRQVPFAILDATGDIVGQFDEELPGSG